MKEFLKKLGVSNEKKMEAYLNRLKSKDPKDDTWKRQFHTAVDYTSHLNADREILVIAERRWDMYHMLAATIIAILLGLGLGIKF